MIPKLPVTTRIRLFRVHNVAVLVFAMALTAFSAVLNLGIREGVVPASLFIVGVLAVMTLNVAFALAFVSECRARRIHGEQIGQWRAAQLSLQLWIPHANLRHLRRRWQMDVGTSS
jgi:hypothetical protein